MKKCVLSSRLKMSIEGDDLTCNTPYQGVPDHVCMMFTTRDTKGHTQMCLTFIFKVNHQGHVTDFGFPEILDLANVRIDTKIKSVACIQPEIRKVIQ